MSALIFLDVDDAAMLGARGIVDSLQIMEESTAAYPLLLNNVIYAVLYILVFFLLVF